MIPTTWWCRNSYFLSLSFFEMLMFVWDFEVGAWSRFWKCLIKICVRTCDLTYKEATLVSRTQPLGPLCLWQCFYIYNLCWSQILPQILNLCWFQIFAQIPNSDSMLIPRQGLNSSHFPKFERSQTDANSNLPDKSRLTNTNRTYIQTPLNHKHRSDIWNLSVLEAKKDHYAGKA